MKEIETGASQGLAQGLTISKWKIFFCQMPLFAAAPSNQEAPQQLLFQSCCVWEDRGWLEKR